MKIDHFCHPERQCGAYPHGRHFLGFKKYQFLKTLKIEKNIKNVSFYLWKSNLALALGKYYSKSLSIQLVAFTCTPYMLVKYHWYLPFDLI